MPIEFRCTHCSRLLRTGEDAVGKKAKCPQCGAILEVPASGEAQQPPSPLAETGAFSPASDSAQQDPFSPGTPTASGEPSPFGGAIPLPPGAPAASGQSSPFGEDIPPSPGAGESENPYESPRGAGLAYGEPPDLLAYARGRVSGPAIALIIVAALNLAHWVIRVGLSAVGMAVPMFLPDAPGMGGLHALPLAINLAASVAFAIPSVLIIVGSVKMMGLQSYAWAMTAAILAVIPIPCITSPCCCAALPFGVWALVVLCDEQVQEAFRSASSL